MRLTEAPERDYYDHYAKDRAFSDSKYVWNRTPRAVRVDFAVPTVIRHESRMWGNRDAKAFEMEAFVVWFCGDAVPVAVVRSEYDGLGRWKTTDFIYALDDIPEFVWDKYDSVKRNKFWSRYSVRSRIEDLFAGRPPTERSWESSLSAAGRKFPVIPVLEMHRRLGTPVFCTAGGIPDYLELEKKSLPLKGRHMVPSCPGVVVNPCLAKIEFRRKIDAFSAFRRLEQFLANDLVPPDVIRVPEPPDKLKAQSHGFDKMSFRKEPTKPRRTA